METTTSTPHRRVWTIVLAALGLLFLLVMSACDSEEPKAPTPTRTAGDVEAMAEDIAADVGKVMHVVEGAPDQIVIVFEETHISPAGQVEIAIMFNRLYEGYGLRHIGLEGALSEHGSLDATWFGPSFTPGQAIGPREDAIVQLLEDGDINAAEMMALIYPDANIAGIDAPEYSVELAENAAGATFVYLYKIAVAGLTQSEIIKANDLLEQGKEDEAFEFILGTDEFTKKTFEQVSDPSVTASCEEMLELIDEIEAKAADVGADIAPEDEENLQALITFYRACSVRSDALSKNTLALAEQVAGAPVAMQIGAGHTSRVKDLLTDAGISFAVIRSDSLEQGRRNGDLSLQAYDRKLAGQSVDPPGSLGALLDDRRKPPPVVGELWVQSKAELFLLTTSIARAAAQGQLSPFDDALGDVLPQLQNLTLVPDTIQVIGNDVVFSAQVLDNNSRPVVVWVRTTKDRDLAERTLNERLFEALSNVQEKDEPSDKPESTESEPRLQIVSSDTIAKFAMDRSVILTTTVSR